MHFLDITGVQFRMLIFCTAIQVSVSRIGFKKDQSITRIDFPPKILPQKGDSGIPRGHLRPLGWQKSPEGRISEMSEMPSPKKFYEDYVWDHKPVVFRGVVNDVPAVKKWAKEDYLKKEFGELNIHVVVKKELFTMGPRKMKFRKFLREYQYEDWYLTNSIPQQMMVDLTLPRCLKCGLRRYLLESELWMSSGGTASLLHSHADHNLHCLLAGRKDFILIDPKHKEKLAFHERDPHPGAGYSEIDMDMINMFKYKEVGKVPWKWSTLKPGDCMYVPAKHLHQVRSYGRSISWTMLWAPAPEADFADCEKVDLNSPMPLQDASLIWTYMDADRQLTNARLNAASLRHHLMLLLRDEDNLTPYLFTDFYEEIMSETDDHLEVSEVWSLMDPGNSGNVSRQAIKDMGNDVLEQVARAVNFPHTSRRDEL